MFCRKYTLAGRTVNTQRPRGKTVRTYGSLDAVTLTDGYHQNSWRIPHRLIALTAVRFVAVSCCRRRRRRRIELR